MAKTEDGRRKTENQSWGDQPVAPPAGMTFQVRHGGSYFVPAEDTEDQVKAIDEPAEAEKTET
jgi:hypothetical protein